MYTYIYSAAQVWAPGEKVSTVSYSFLIVIIEIMMIMIVIRIIMIMIIMIKGVLIITCNNSHDGVLGRQARRLAPP